MPPAGQNYRGSKLKDFTGSASLCPRWSNEPGFSTGSYDYDCILLDLMLPGGDGLDILRRIRERQCDVGVIIISAKGSLDDKLRGLEIGADDYLPKPFALPELSMRIYALIRRKEFSASNVLQSGPVSIDLLEHVAAANGTPMELTKTEYDLLLFFVSNRGRVIAKSARFLFHHHGLLYRRPARCG